MNRREFLRHSAVAAGALSLPAMTHADPLYRISLAQWSLHRTFFGDSLRSGSWAQLLRTPRYREVLAGEVDPIEFPRIAKEQFGIDAVEYVNTFYFDRADDRAYLSDLRERANAHGVRSLLIMIDREGALGAADPAARAEAVRNHHRWVRAAEFLGCHSIRVNAASEGTYEQQQRRAADGLRQLCNYADDYNINVIVENHGGLSSNGEWLAGVIRMVDHPRAGTLPDFGNFRVSNDPEVWYDRYKGVEELMPYAKAVSAKAHVFDENGFEARTDFRRMMRIVLDHGYRGYVGIEYEGDQLSEPEGILATKRLLEVVRDELAPRYAAAPSAGPT